MDRAKELPPKFTIGHELPDIPLKTFERENPFTLKWHGEFIERHKTAEEARSRAWEIWDCRVVSDEEEAIRLLACDCPAQAAMKWLSAWIVANETGEREPSRKLAEDIVEALDSVDWKDGTR